MILTQYALLFLLFGVVHCLEPRYDVLGPKRWTVGVPEMFTIESFGHERRFPVQASLRRHFTILKTKPGDSPSRDDFGYLEDEAKDFNNKEEKIALTDGRRVMFTQEKKTDFKKPKRSKRYLKKEIEELTKNYPNKLKRLCCWNGYDQYTKYQDCHIEQKEEDKTKERRSHCYKAFHDCCSYSRNHYEKMVLIAMSPGTPPRYCVSNPKFWKVGEPQKVGFKDSLLFSKQPGYLVRMLLLSYPDKNVTYDSQEFRLNPTDDLQETDVSLLFQLKDLPNGDDLEKFVYLVTEFEDHVIEQKLPLLDLRVTQLDLKKPNGSNEDLESEIEALARKYLKWEVKQTCWRGYNYYKEELECQNRMTEMDKEGMMGLYRVFRKCCLHSREYNHKLANTEPKLHNIKNVCKHSGGIHLL